jgi:hypothetical protein
VNGSRISIVIEVFFFLYTGFKFLQSSDSQTKIAGVIGFGK